MPCLGRNQEQHCCIIRNEVCRFLEENSEPGFRWSCGLRRELGSWDAVLADPRYKEHVENSWADGINCRDWPDKWPEGKPGCNICGSAM